MLTPMHLPTSKRTPHLESKPPFTGILNVPTLNRVKTKMRYKGQLTQKMELVTITLAMSSWGMMLPPRASSSSNSRCSRMPLIADTWWWTEQTNVTSSKVWFSTIFFFSMQQHLSPIHIGQLRTCLGMKLYARPLDKSVPTQLHTGPLHTCL